MQPQVRVAALTNYAEVARFVGLDPHKMLRRARIDIESLSDPEQRIATVSVAKVLEDSARESGCAAFGLLMAETRSIASMGAVSLLLEHQRTARDVLDGIVQYQGLMGEAFAIAIEDIGRTAIARIDIVAEFPVRQGLELLMGMTYRTISAIVRGRWRPESVHFVHDAPADLGVHRRVFQCPLVFRSEFNGFACSAASLDAPNPAADTVMARNAERYLQMLTPESVDGSVTERARRSIQLLLPAARATLDQVAGNMAVHPRMLQRALEREGRTFAILLNEVRRELALRYLSGSTHNVASIALMTGYATPSSFTRWFCAEFGMSPAAWRTGEPQEADQGVLGLEPSRRT